MKKTVTIVKDTFTIIGFFLLLGAFSAYTSVNAFMENAIKTQGVVTDLVRSRSTNNTSYYYAPVVKFMTQQGQIIEFVSSTSSSPASYSIGEKVSVLYSPDKPQDAKIDDFFSLWGAALVLGGIGAMFSLFGIGFFLATTLKNRKDKYLKKHGTPIETKFQSVQLNTGLEVNGRNPFQVLTQWQNPSTSEIHVFKSNNLWFDPTDYIGERTITVYIDNDNPDKYFVDLSFLPKVAG